MTRVRTKFQQATQVTLSSEESEEQVPTEEYLKKLLEVRKRVAQRREEMRLGIASANSTSEGSAGSAGAQAIAKPKASGKKRGEP